MSAGNGSNLLSQTMLDDAHVTKEEEATIRAIFDAHSTRTFMNEKQFTSLMVPLGIREDYCPAFFHAFDTTRPAGLIDFHQFFVGIIAIDPDTPHGSGWMAERLAYIFAVYDLNDDGYIDTREFATMVKHIRRSKGLSESPEEVQQEAELQFKSFEKTKEDRINFEQYLAAVNALKFRGTSRLFRTTTSAFRSKKVAPNVKVVAASEASSSSSETPSTPKVAALTYRARTPEPDSGRLTDSPVRLNPRHVFASSDEVYSALARRASHKSGFRLSLPTGDVAQSGPFSVYARKKIDFIDPELLEMRNDPNELAMRVITRTVLQKWEPPVVRTFTLLSVAEIKELCLGAIEVLGNDSTLAKVTAPCKVFGDIHGQMSDLLSFFQTYGAPNHRTGDINLASYVFLGDYVDRGRHSLEVAITLIALKIRYPSRIFLTRGNHEDRGINAFHGFLAECQERFGEAGETVWDAINEVFDWLPLGVLIEESILGVHGGIGARWETLEQLNKFERPINLAQHVSDNPSIVKDILWSDPTSTDHVFGVHANPPRGVNMVAFGPDRVLEFCQNNNLGMIIRAHECVEDGYELFASGHLVTVFSATNYQGKYSNHGAYLEISADLEVTPKLIRHPDRQDDRDPSSTT